MFAPTATPTAGVWLITNLTNEGKIQPSGRWWNTLENGVIKEFCNDTKCSSTEFDQENGRERIIFIKNEHGEYEFYGLYQCEVVNSTTRPFERKYVLLQATL